MTEKTKKIQKLLESLDWVFGTGFHERCMVMKKDDIPSGAIAEIFYRKEYQDVEVSIYPSFFGESLAKQRKAILHELCHIITIPSKAAMHQLLDGKLVTADQIHQINEEETSKIENIFDSLLRGRMIFAKKAYAEYTAPKRSKPKVNKKTMATKKPAPKGGKKAAPFGGKAAPLFTKKATKKGGK